jgi:hypothetical protein
MNLALIFYKAPPDITISAPISTSKLRNDGAPGQDRAVPAREPALRRALWTAFPG